MKKINHQLLFILLINLLPSFLCSQNFINGDLDGNASAVNNRPTNWTAVPHTDPICSATSPAQATVDITNLTGPVASVGISGAPQSGNTFVSALNGGISSVTFFHEGIQQTVSGFVIGTNYTIELYQTVVKQVNALDQTGSWSVYEGNNLLATTAISTSTLGYTNTALVWDMRSVTFTATATSMTFKFMPTDDDADGSLSSSNLSGGLRMGIDNISITSPLLATELIDFRGHLENAQVELFWETAMEKNNHYFVVEYSLNGIGWEELERIEGAGNSGNYLHYNYTDKDPISAVNYYRLKQVEYDGTSTYSDIVAVEYTKDYTYNIYPNPAIRQMTIALSSRLENPSVLIYDVKGQKYIVPSQINGNKIILEVAQLPQGVYYIVIQAGENVFQQTFQKL